MKKLAPFTILSAAVLWGSMGIVTRYVGSVGFTVVQTAAVRILSATLVLFLFLCVSDRRKLKISLKDIKWFLGTGILSLFINNLAYAATVQMASLSVAVVLLYTAPFFVMIMSVLFFKERITAVKIAALMLAFFGCVLVAGLSGADTKASKGITILVGLSAGFGYSLYSIFGKVLVEKYHSLTVTFYTFLFASAGTTLFAKPVDMCSILFKNVDKLPVIVIGSVITLAMPYLLYSIGLSYMESSKASIIASFEVVAASLFGVILYGEALNIYNITGILFVVIALIILQIKRNTL